MNAIKSPHVSNIIALCILAIILSGTFYYLYSTRPCAQPIYYKIGTFDPRFGINQTDFLIDAQEAANLWNQEAGHVVLAYSATGTMPVNLVYDTRQQETDVGESITQQEADLASEKTQIETLQNQYNAAKQQYLSDQATGKSPQTLNTEAAALNQMAAQIQTLVNTLNAKVAVLNSNANAFNTQAGVDFEEGEFVESYGSKYIDLYEFTNNTQLVRLMAHEFGHSLGLAHNADPASIMYPENIGTTIALSPEDKAELQARCALTLKNLNPFQNASLSSS